MNILMLYKFNKPTWKDAYRLPMALILGLLVMRNYSLRRRHRIPDRWYWADELLVKLGYFMRWGLHE